MLLRNADLYGPWRGHLVLPRMLIVVDVIGHCAQCFAAVSV